MVLYNFHDVDYVYSIKCYLQYEDEEVVDGVIKYKKQSIWRKDVVRTKVKFYDSKIRKERSISVYAEEGMVMDRHFWLSRKNDKLARKIIVNYFKDKYEEQKDSLRKLKDTYDRVKYLYEDGE